MNLCVSHTAGVTSVAELLILPAGASLTLLAGPASGRVERLALVEDPARVEGEPAGTLAILTAAASRGVDGYVLDVTLRRAVAAGLAGVVLVGPLPLAATAGTIAGRGSLAVLGAPADADLAALTAGIARELAGVEEGALLRASDAQRAIEAAEEAGAGVDELLEAARAAGGVALRLGPADGPGVPVAVDGRVEARLVGGDPAAAVTALVTWLAAGAAGRVLTAARRGEEAPRRSRAALLAELLLARSAPGDERLDRARAAGVAIDGWHVAARVESRGRSAVTQGDPVSEHALDESLHRLALQAARAAGGAWQAATVESALVLVCSDRSQGAALRRDRVDGALRHVLGRIESAFPPLQLACGVGGAHEGLAGLRASAAEARAALASRRAGGGRSPIQRFDELGAHRLVADVLASEQARTAIADLLAPLDRLGGRRAETAVQTLAAYLDEQGSVVRTAAVLGVHRNAVSQRMGRVATALDVDLGDPETRLALQIACRARRLGSPT